MRKFLIKMLVLVFIFANIFTTLSIVEYSAFPQLYSEAIFLMDGITGDVLYEQNADVLYEPASTTKVMTAILAIENCNLDEPITIGKNPPLVDGSRIGIAEGEVYTMKELLLGLLLESGNDCAEAIAEHISGSNSAFGKLMTEKAHEIGATSTTFKNPSGLSEEGHVTTAHDLALIMQYALSLPAFIEISRTPYYFFEDHPFEDGTEKWATNRNNCLGEDSTYYYEYLYSGKTGYTPEANHTYTAAAKKDDQLLVGAFLNGVDKAGFYTSVGELFNWGFENFQTKKIISKGDTLDEYILDDNTTIPLLATEDIYYTSSSNITTINTSVEYTNKDFSTTSIRKGDILFNASLLVNGESYKNIDLSSGITREYTTEVQLQQAIEKVTKKKSFIPRILTVFIIIILLLVLLILRIRYVKRRRSFLKRRHKIRKKHNF